MPVAPPNQPRIYHIVHIDRLESIIANDGLFCDAEILRREIYGTTIGMDRIKHRRLTQLTLPSFPNLHVGECVPFYFCPRSVMLFLLYKGDHPDLSYRGGEDNVIHLVADLYSTVAWAEENHRRWVFTLSNAGSSYFEDRCDLTKLGDIHWDAVQANQWKDCKEEKQAEFLVETYFPWRLIDEIGVKSRKIYERVKAILGRNQTIKTITLRPEWYYG
jgi:hypothetical protein